MKKIAILSLFLMISSIAVANENKVNIYDMPRVPPQTPFFDSYGKSYSLSSFKGKFTLAVFWSRYCAPCLKEMDELNDFANKTATNGIKVILISPEAEWTSAESRSNLLKKYKAEDLEDFVDRKGDVASDMGIYRTPHTVLLDVKGQEVGRISGAADWGSSAMAEYIYKVKADSTRYIQEHEGKSPNILGTDSKIKVQDI